MKCSLIAGLTANGGSPSMSARSAVERGVPRPRRGNSLPRRELVGVPLVRRPADGPPLRDGDAIGGAERIAVLGDGRHDLVTRRVQDPTVETQALARGQQRVARRLVVAQILDLDGMAGVPREARDRPLVVDDHDRDAPPAEPPGDAEADVVAADDDRARAGPPPVARPVSSSEDPDRARCGGPRRQAHRLRSVAIRPAIWREAYHVPDTNLMSGPKLHAAGAPAKCSPVTELSRPRPSTG